MPPFYGASSHIGAARRYRSSASSISLGTCASLDPQAPSDFLESSSVCQRRASAIREEDWSQILAVQGLKGLASKAPINDGLPQRFHTIVGLLVLVNALYIGIDTDLSSGAGHVTSTVLNVIENVFCVIWILELIIRLKALRWVYFLDRYNLLDFSLVWLGVFTTWVTPFLSESTLNSKVGGVSLDSLLTILRILKLLRLIKLMRLIPKLWILVGGFVSAGKTLGWVVVLLFGTTYTGAVVMTILVGQQCKIEYGDWEACDDHFGNIARSMFTMFQVMTFESWSTAVARPVLAVKPFLIIFFLCYFAVTSFGLINVIVGVVVENTLQAADEQRRAEEEIHQQNVRVELTTLRELFEQADANGSGCVDRDEFVEIMTQPRVKTKLRELNIPHEFPDKVFEYLDQDESGEMTIEEFIDGAMKMKSDPSSSDMRTMVMQVSLIANKVTKVEALTTAIASELGLVNNFGEEGSESVSTSVHSTTIQAGPLGRGGKWNSRKGVGGGLAAGKKLSNFFSRICEEEELTDSTTFKAGGPPSQGLGVVLGTPSTGFGSPRVFGPATPTSPSANASSLATSNANSNSNSNSNGNSGAILLQPPPITRLMRPPQGAPTSVSLATEVRRDVALPQPVAETTDPREQIPAIPSNHPAPMSLGQARLQTGIALATTNTGSPPLAREQTQGLTPLSPPSNTIVREASQGFSFPDDSDSPPNRLWREQTITSIGSDADTSQNLGDRSEASQSPFRKSVTIKTGKREQPFARPTGAPTLAARLAMLENSMATFLEQVGKAVQNASLEDPTVRDNRMESTCSSVPSISSTTAYNSEVLPIGASESFRNNNAFDAGRTSSLNGFDAGRTSSLNGFDTGRTSSLNGFDAGRTSSLTNYNSNHTTTTTATTNYNTNASNLYSTNASNYNTNSSNYNTNSSNYNNNNHTNNAADPSGGGTDSSESFGRRI